MFDGLRWDDLFEHFDAITSSGYRASACSPEYHLPRRHAVAAIDAVLGIAATIESVVLVSEIRTVAADSLWMSPQ